MATQDGELNYNVSEMLGKGSCGTVVFRGTFGPDRMPVAVKRLQRLLDSDSVQKEVELMKKAMHHPNILRFIHIETDTHFLFIVTERCSGTLGDYFKNTYQGPQIVSEWEMLRQLTSGLEHLHDRLKIVHRDIKPTNILIFEPDRSNPILKLADFGISKALQRDADAEDFTNTNVANPNGTRGWMAPEVYENPRFDFAVDIFALGLIFGYILTGGNHPFGKKSEDRIKAGESMLLVRKDLKKPYSMYNGTFKLLKSMLKMKSLKRPSITEVNDRLREIARSLKLFDLEKTNELITVCCSAVISGDELALFQRLVNHPKADIHGVTTTNGSTPLHELCKYCQNDNLKDLVQLLIQKGADVNAKDECGSTPLRYLCANYDKVNTNDLIDIIRVLVENGADANTGFEDKWTPLQFVCRYFQKENLIDIVQLLVEGGAEVNIQNSNGVTPLHFLCAHYQNDNLPGIIQLFLGKGADVNAKTKNGLTPLHFLCRYYQNENLPGIIQLFLDKDADVNTKNKDGVTPLHFLCAHYQNDNLPGIIQLFLGKGADVNAKTKNGLTPLHFLCVMYKNDNLPGIIQLLLDKDADVNAKDEEEWTPLHVLCRYYKIGESIKRKVKKNLKSMITLLVAKGASMDAENNEGETPNDFMRARALKTMSAIEPTNRAAAPVMVDVPDEPITKDEDATA